MPLSSWYLIDLARRDMTTWRISSRSGDSNSVPSNLLQFKRQSCRLPSRELSGMINLTQFGLSDWMAK